MKRIKGRNEKQLKTIRKGHRFHHIYQKTGQVPERPKGGHITRATTITTKSTQDISSTKQGKGLLKQVNFTIDISELHGKVDKFQGCNLRNNFLVWTNIT